MKNSSRENNAGKGVVHIWRHIFMGDDIALYYFYRSTIIIIDIWRQFKFGKTIPKSDNGLLLLFILECCIVVILIKYNTLTEFKSEFFL